jgi:hypothetical protein
MDFFFGSEFAIRDRFLNCLGSGLTKLKELGILFMAIFRRFLEQVD